MAYDLEYNPPTVEFDDSLAAQLEQIGTALPPAAPLDPQDFCADAKTPFVDYVRMLTPEGGILILYRDLAVGWIYTVLRVVGFTAVTWIEVWLLGKLPVSDTHAVIWFVIICALNLFLATRKIKIRHSVEIRHDRMILDFKQVFWARYIGCNWPQLQMKDNDPNKLVISGIYGTRWVEYMTANRVHEYKDRTPEVLAADLQDAMEKLWGRSELTFGD
jgi:hypothetical protein